MTLHPLVRAGAVALALIPAACATPEAECREGVKQMKQRTASYVGVNQPPDVQRALESVYQAETQLATGNFEGCLTSIEDARTYLRRSIGNNQQ